MGAICNLCERQSETQGSMPFSSLDRPLMDRQQTLNGAWQQWIGLPEGASFWSRLNSSMDLSKPSRTFFTANVSSVPTSASPCAGDLCGLTLWNNPCLTSQGECGQLEDGVLHADALSPANLQSTTRRHERGASAQAQFTLVIPSLATTPQTSPK